MLGKYDANEYGGWVLSLWNTSVNWKTSAIFVIGTINLTKYAEKLDLVPMVLTIIELRYPYWT